MNITHIITGLNDGGAEGVLFRLCTHDKENRHVVISLMDEGKYGPRLRTEGVDIHCLNMPRGRVTLTGITKLYRLLRRIRPDVVQTWMYHADLLGGVVARLAGIKAICWGIRHSNLEPGKSASSTIIIARLCAILSRWIPRAIVSCSAQAAGVHQRLGYVKEKFTVIANGYNLEEFSPTPQDGKRLRTEWEVNDDTPLLGMVARFDPQKDHLNLLQALARLKETGQVFRCVLVGTGMEHDNRELQHWIAQAGVENHIMLLGRRNDIPAVMAAIDVHVLSSSFGEAFPNVLAEAMACATPCVATDVGDAALIVGDTGWVVPPSNPDALFQSVSHAIAEMKDAEKWAQRKANCRLQVVDNFSIEKMIESFHAAWGEVQ
ncbi:glycosyltransferase family 4 protein [Geoalkalibacter halelectricus]|uniref:Glycosyltransferase n=1 Tax=Geoalkalibacter halelectricus TaxID=2847045 RepID=A0ABY5ZKJ3_9BACT|nr:glycosyltransferase [Geoalkalibacter halelectricus]MDO3377829.1 glycosyltransferase [Geoalkalibacter halelectricus]UWZ79578.1 glycosyltransferase [Geoalkalibacter halelectricus]